MSQIRQKLESLEAIFKAANAPILKHFNAGLQKEKIVSFFLEHGIPTHDDLITLYQWHNGLKSIYGNKSPLIEIKPTGCFPNLNEMLALRNDFLRYDYFEVENRSEYVPFLSGGEDDMQLLRVSTGQIYYSSPGIQVYCEPDFVSLSSMLDFILKCYQTNLLRIDSNEGLQVDDKYWEFQEHYQNP